jgi:hypothetical protein
MAPLIIALAGLALVWLLTLGLSFVWPAIAIVPIGLGWVAAIAGWIWFLVVAFQDSALAGVLCLVVPFYSLYYLITHFDETKMPFFVYVLGFIFVLTGSCAGGFSAPGKDDVPRGVRSEYRLPCRAGEMIAGMPPAGPRNRMTQSAPC